MDLVKSDTTTVTGPKAFDSLAEIVAAASGQVEYVYIEGFTPMQTFKIGSLSAGDLIEWSEASEDAKRTAGLRLICKSLVNEANVRYSLEDKNIHMWKTISHKVTERIVKEILKLNGMIVKGDDPKKT